MKLRMVRHLRTPEYNELFGGDPMWITESVGGMGDGRPSAGDQDTPSAMLQHPVQPGARSRAQPDRAVERTTCRRTSSDFCAKISIDTDSIQYENDDVMRPVYGDDYAIACCVSAMRVGKQMQFFGARCQPGQAACCYAINGGRGRAERHAGGPARCRLSAAKYLDYDEVMERFDVYRDWLAKLYVNAMNIIHYMHDKYCLREDARWPCTTPTCSASDGLRHRGPVACVADSLSAIKYAKVKRIRATRTG